MLGGPWLGTWAYHVRGLRFEFESKGGFSAKAEFEAGGVKVEPGLNVDWESDSVLRLEGTPAAPFAVQGLRV